MTVGVIGLGYVGLPLAVAFAEAGEDVIAVDLDERKIAAIDAGTSYIEDIASERLQAVLPRIEAWTHFAPLARADAIFICVPTPLTPNREPDLEPLVGAGRALGHVVQRGQLVVLESTTYPGTTRERLLPLLEASRPEGRRRHQSRLLARARRPRPHRLHHAQHTQGRGRRRRGSARGAPSRSTRGSAIAWSRSPAPRLRR